MATVTVSQTGKTTLTGIANYLGVTLAELEAANPQLKRNNSWDLIYPSDVINIPVKSTTTSTTTTSGYPTNTNPYAGQTISTNQNTGSIFPNLGIPDTGITSANSTIATSQPTTSYTAPATAVPLTKTYVVKSGDTLSQIAKNYNTTIDNITGYRSGNPNLIYPGETLTINTSVMPSGSDQASIDAAVKNFTPSTTFRPRGEYESMDDYLKAKQAWEISQTGQTGITLTGAGGTGDTGTPGTGNAGAGDTTGGGDTTGQTGDSTLDNILLELQKILTKMTEEGKVVNPNIELTPAEIQAFLDQAKTELNPYYTSYIDTIGKELSANLKQLQENYDLTKEQRLAEFQANLANQRENEATRGTIFSGGRLERANALKSGAERSLESLTSSTLNAAANQGMGAEKEMGSTNLGSVAIPSIRTNSLSLLGEGQYVPIEDRSLYSLMGGVYGTKTAEQTTAERVRAAELEQAARQSRALNFYQ